MADYLKHYQMELKAIGPVHIGSGKKLLKKEYIYRWRRGIVLIPDETALIDGLRKYHVEDKFIDYILRGSNYKDLGGWLDDQGIPRTEYEQWVSYRLEGGDILAERSKGIDVLTCLKDNYRKPYIPGSSIKGMFRTILLAAEQYDVGACWVHIRNRTGKRKSSDEEIRELLGIPNNYAVLNLIALGGKGEQKSGYSESDFDFSKVRQESF